MTMPPRQNRDPFDLFVEELGPVYREFGFVLDFTQYNELMEIYSQLTPFDAKKSEYLTHNFITCQDTLIGYLSVAQKLMLDADTTEREIEAKVSVTADVKSAANGKRLADRNEEVVFARKNSNLLVSFHDGLRARLELLKQAHYACKLAWEIADDANKRKPMNQQYRG